MVHSPYSKNMSLLYLMPPFNTMAPHNKNTRSGTFSTTAQKPLNPTSFICRPLSLRKTMCLLTTVVFGFRFIRLRPLPRFSGRDNPLANERSHILCSRRATLPEHVSLAGTSPLRLPPWCSTRLVRPALRPIVS